MTESETSDQPAAQLTTQPEGDDLPDDQSTDQPEGQAVIGVRFREAARLYHYSAPHGALFPGDYVVVETARGEELARVVTVPEHDAPPQRAPRGRAADSAPGRPGGSRRGGGGRRARAGHS